MNEKVFFFCQSILVLIVGLTPLYVFASIYTISRKDFVQEYQAHVGWGGNSLAVMLLGMLGAYGLGFVELVIGMVLAAREGEARRIFWFILLFDLLLAILLSRFVIIPEIDHLFSCCN